MEALTYEMDSVVSRSLGELRTTSTSMARELWVNSCSEAQSIPTESEAQQLEAYYLFLNSLPVDT